MQLVETAPPSAEVLPMKTAFSNVPPSVEKKIGRNLHNQKNHPLEILKRHIYDYFLALDGYNFSSHDSLSPAVSLEDNFDKLLIPQDHPARGKTDTYYVNEGTVLRTHTSAHQNELLAQGHRCFLVTGDVYRKDEIDRSHYPVFHQMEGLCIVDDGVDPKDDLMRVIGGLIEHLFPGCEWRLNADYFPFTDPSFEIEVRYQDKWLEILGMGVVQPKILENNGFSGERGWAFGVGLERLAMLFFDINDIRVFWSEDPKFLSQFESGEFVKFKEFSNVDPVEKDISFWLDSDEVAEGEDGDDDWTWTDANSFYELIRENSEDLIEESILVDRFFHPKKKRFSHTYRLRFSPAATVKDPAEFTSAANEKMEMIRSLVAENLRIELREK
ncbi:unnamed protein product [Vitrella brassicaformis CCMP3155]|uniref:phenylalanine--tRNA ligase n=2 Tax=Vitrella brassicaformis TaxID=1169539 RepID=A0A0G4FMZ8_VITBC|nr:unnamed protein product [Vitrella brassicaformis CCMP3155]|eukprot:CEM15625.1 unnamed protein product [Vitrella brassicaformis CCMP3155]